MGASGVSGIDMADIKNIDGFSVPPVSITLLADLDFTTMTSASWIGESTVSLNSQTWTIGNGSNVNDFGPNDSTLIFSPKGTSVCDWWGSARTGPYLSIKLSALDSSLDATAQYIVQTVYNEFPAGVSLYARIYSGFWSDVAASKGYTCLFGNIYNGQEAVYCYVGQTTDQSTTADQTERTFYTYLDPTSFNEVRTSTAADGNTPYGGDIRASIYASYNNPGTTMTYSSLVPRPMTASADINVGLVAVGYNGTSAGPTYKVDRFRVWKLKAST